MNFGEDKEQSLKNLQILYERFVFFFMDELTEIWLAASLYHYQKRLGLEIWLKLPCTKSAACTGEKIIVTSYSIL